MEKAYKPQKSESEIYRLWEEGGYFTPALDFSKQPFTIIMPLPNANGVLHAGHAVFVTLQDIMIRYRRMKGESALWLPGADHAGIATQVVYEKELAKQGKTRFDLGREEFYKQAWEFTTRNIGVMENQLRKLGASCDWTRKKFTLEPRITESVYHTFKKMYDEGLIYRGERIINWCSRCRTALSDLEVKYEEKQSKLTFIKYPVIDSMDFVIVATTRPETMLGDTAVAVNPKDKRYDGLLKKKARLRLPLTDRIIPLIADEKVEMEFGTGAVKVTPGHDPADFEIGKAHNLAIIKIIDETGKMKEETGKDYAGMSVSECRKKVMEDLKKLGFLEKQEDYKHSFGTCERCATIIEPLVSEQWFVKAKELAKPAIEAVKKGEIKFIPAHFTKVYYNWMENIKDWCVSRQIWWGQRIPVWHCSCGGIMVEVKPPKSCSKCGSNDLRQDPDTLDTWFSSGQWPFTVFGWPKETKDYKYFYPTAVMETGYDILFFWVGRMIMMGIYCTGKAPFKYVYLHGLVRDKDRKKMSKSKGNVIDPLGVVDLYGADALRMALVFGTGPGRDAIISEQKIVSQRHFANKVWNAARFTLSAIADNYEFLDAEEKKFSFTEEDRWILSEMDSGAKNIDAAIQNFSFNQAAEEIYDFFWHKFCDKTIENVKKRLFDDKGSAKDKLTAKWVLYKVFTDSIKLLHPFMPFVTETIYQSLPRKQKKALIIEDWPVQPLKK